MSPVALQLEKFKIKQNPLSRPMPSNNQKLPRTRNSNQLIKHHNLHKR